MCTVTFFPISENEFILTSNRDEVPERGTIPPKIRPIGRAKSLYPKDSKAGGTWIGATSKRRIVTLMNGGSEPHIRRKGFYKSSRGIIVLKLLVAKNSIEFIENSDFTRIEPFTIILFEAQPTPVLYQIIWDEKKIHIKNMELKPTIWSSSPLYTPEIHELRKSWLHDFIEKKAPITAEKIWEFHHSAGGDDKKISLKMDRGFIHTKSITQYRFDIPSSVHCRYHDLEQGDIFDSDLKLRL